MSKSERPKIQEVNFGEIYQEEEWSKTQLVNVGFQVLDENWLDPCRVSVDLCKKQRRPRRELGVCTSYFEFFLFLFLLLFLLTEELQHQELFGMTPVTPITFRFLALFPMATRPLLPRAVTVAVVYWLRVCKGGCCNVHEQSNK